MSRHPVATPPSRPRLVAAILAGGVAATVMTSMFAAAGPVRGAATAIGSVAAHGSLEAARYPGRRDRRPTRPSPSPTVAPTATATPIQTPAPTDAPAAAGTASEEPVTASPSPTAEPTPTPTVEPSPTPTASPSPTPTASPSPTPATSTLATGMAAHLMWQTLSETNADLDRMRAAGMDYVRFDVSWRNSEPTKGTYQYLEKLDQVISAVQSRGMALTMTVIETPGWANGNAGMFAPPTNMADYGSFLGVLAKRYANRTGMVWEIWNEENDPHFWTTGPNATQYAGMLKAAYAAIKANDPDATVVTGGILFNNTAFLEGLYSAGAGSSFDGLAIHPYTVSRAPSDTSSPYYSFASSVPQFQSVLAAHGQGSKPIWVTEFGWSTAKVSDTTRATWFRDAVTIARGWTNVRGLGAYTLHQSQFAEYGLLTTTGSATQSWTSYAAAQ